MLLAVSALHIKRERRLSPRATCSFELCRFVLFLFFSVKHRVLCRACFIRLPVLQIKENARHGWALMLPYSVLSATTGSFLAALLEGISPEMRVRKVLIRTSIIAPPIGRIALRFAIPVSLRRIRLIGMQSV